MAEATRKVESGMTGDPEYDPTSEGCLTALSVHKACWVNSIVKENLVNIINGI